MQIVCKWQGVNYAIQTNKQDVVTFKTNNIYLLSMFITVVYKACVSHAVVH